MLARVMRRWDIEGLVDPDALGLGEFIIKCGLARFPNHPMLLILLANLHLEVRGGLFGFRVDQQVVGCCRRSHW